MESYCYPRSFRKMPHRRTTDTELSPTLFNIFLERIMTDALEDHEGTVGIGGRTIINLRFADDIDGLAGEELANLVERLDKASTAYGMEINTEKTKLMTNNTSGINSEIKVNGQKLETVTSFKYLASVLTDEGSKPEILSRIAQTTAELQRRIQAMEMRCYCKALRISCKDHVTNEEVCAKIQQAVSPQNDLLTLSLIHI